MLEMFHNKSFVCYDLFNFIYLFLKHRVLAQDRSRFKSLPAVFWLGNLAFNASESSLQFLKHL